MKKRTNWEELKMKLKKTNIYSRIDPRIQRHMDRLAKGYVPKVSASTDAGEISVIAKVEDLDKWINLSEVREGAVIGKGPDNNFIVTARVPVSRAEYIRKQPFVVSLKPAHPLKLQLSATIEEINSRADLLPQSAEGNQGEGVIIGIIDYGCDFVHKNFRTDDGSTRILAIWDQGGVASPDSPFGYGRIFEQNEINEAVQTDDPYSHLGYGPSQDTNGTHGTHVMDITGGNGNGSGTPGVAPNADLVFVHIDNNDIDWSGPGVVNT
ncbi:MAG: S8 family serine peptidase, partial [bacterium]|nr:S8 family serine peptidase [bacterium]